MFKQTLQVIWNRRRANALVFIEIGLAFVATFAVLAIAIHYWSSNRRPLGFESDRIWAVELRTAQSAVQLNEGWTTKSAYQLRGVLAAVRGLPGVQAAHVIRVTPFTGIRSKGPYQFKEGEITGVSQDAMTTGALEALGTKLVEGRMFNQTDEGQSYRAAVVNRAYVEQVLGDGADPLGKNINQLREQPKAAQLDDVPAYFLREVRIVGVIANFRTNHLADEVPMVLTQYELEHVVENAVEHPNGLFVKVDPGTNASLEQAIMDTVKSVAPEWDSTVIRWNQLRERMDAQVLTPVLVGGVVTGFVLVMVVLGLIGVVGLDVDRRTQEIGLRRAIGASASRVRSQIVLEALTIGLFGILCGTAIAVQLPLFGLVEQIDWSTTAPGMILAAAMIILLVTASALYPAWVASHRNPADALRYE